MNNDYGFENENSENNIPLDFSKNNPQNLDVEIDFSSPSSPSDSSTEVSEDEKNVDNTNNIINSENSAYNQQNSNIRQNFQPNYYSYQQSYQQQLTTEQIKLFYERRAVKKTANHIGLGLILFYAFQVLFSIILGFFAVSEAAYKFLSDSAVNLELNIILTLIGFGFAAFFIFRTEKSKADSLISYGLPKKGSFWPAIGVGLGFCYVANIATSLLQSRFQNILPFAQNDIVLPDGILGFTLSILSVAVAPALLEELLFRGAIMGSLLKYGKELAIFASAFMFALVHGNLVQIPFAFLVGLVLGAMVVETGSIWTGVAIHFFNNLISVLMDYASRFVEQEIFNVFYLFLLSIFIIIGILCFYVLSIKNKKLFAYKKTMHISTAMQKFGWFSSSVTVIIYFVIIFLEILAMQLNATITG